MSLTYIPPQIVNGRTVVQLEAEEVEPEEEKWNFALIVYIIGETPGYNAMSRYISQNWLNIDTPELYLHDEGYYVVRFNSITDMHIVYYAGPYTLSNRSIILKPWTTDFDFSKEFPTEIPLWVKFPNLPINCWGSKSLSRIASALGTPVFADECTTKQTRISFARMLVEINISRPLLDEITVVDPKGKYFQQTVTHDWKPEFCGVCQVVGHRCREKGKEDNQQDAQRKRKRSNKAITQEYRCKGPVQTTLTDGEQVKPLKEDKQQSQQLNEEKSVTLAGRVEEKT
ncbi:PREDICTED: uncharacterized protein LOC109243506 [Nicotiana attenuata]|uniref:uncharacterized protein LOC109243506 n=1 Tax=Nicotiana attenuata TaxID=49451 RepID=UPI0009055F4E|nr:PREDICTED: uncharacterized protein LOC109243506 [Nicotiana attenuata]